MSDPGNSIDVEQWANSIGVDVSGSFRNSSPTAVTVPVHEGPIDMSAVEKSNNVGADNPGSWNVAAIMCGDSSGRFTDGKFYGSGSIDGSSISFWELEWESLNISWKSNSIEGHISWPFRPVTRAARHRRRNGLGPSRPGLNVEGYSSKIALLLVKETLKNWLCENRGYCILIGGPGARMPYPELSRHFVTCFGFVPYQSHLRRDCFLDAVCNVIYLHFGLEKAAEVSNLLPSAIAMASRSHRRYNEGEIEVSDLINVGHMGPIFQHVGGDLSIKKVVIPKHGYREPPSSRFNWVFHTLESGHVYIMRIFESHIVDHVVVVDRRKWPSLIYDPADQYPIMMSSAAFFKCAGPDAIKAKVIQLYRVFVVPKKGGKLLSGQFRGLK